ncbi:Oidioi.mRNA.OKI2018_I69.XSR.g15303.t1.cds [Oikopleura dioica]|uniref:Oidioi.mRNA.OKI2018_I69.XSR.g15303.t1.cds n=1 Tax=Oikopleura dioica TaxID=34765 RepID=A0ABN7SCX6_OIKDI|nr:Oidioi.mRNA.OKI2018_I69.XSR.g15303.t1.cds [Oikopleura dioica]
MGKSPNPTADGKCMCCNCEQILEQDDLRKAFTKNTKGTLCCLCLLTGPLAPIIAYLFFREEMHVCPSCKRECIHNF